MRKYRYSSYVVGAAFLIFLAGCASEPAATDTESQVADAGDVQPSTAEQEPETDTDTASSETTIPAGAYAASADFPFPVPEGWAVLYPFTEGTLGKDVSMDASVEYPGDAKEAAATYLSILTAAGFDANTYAPGELTNQASLVAKGRINDTAYTTLLNFDVHADGLQRVSITAVEDD